MPKKWRMFNSVRMKLAFSYLLIVVIPVTLSGILLYYQMIVAARNQAESELSESAQSKSAIILARCAELQKSAEHFSRFNGLYQFFNNLYLDEADLITSYNQKIHSIFSWFSDRYPNINRINFFGGTNIVESTYFHYSEDLQNETWFQEMKKHLNDDEYFWESPHIARNYRFSSGKSTMVYSLFIRVLSTQDVYMEVEITVTDLFRTDSNSLILDSSGSSVIYPFKHNFDFPLTESNLHTVKEKINHIANKNGYLARVLELPELNAILVETRPISEHTASEQAARNLFTIVIIVLLLSLMAYTYIMSNHLSKRVNRITKAVERIHSHDYDIHIPADSSDELGLLAKRVNEMAARIDHLLNKVLFVEMAAKESELRALQSQIHPHFTYNTLETFRMMAEIDNNSILAEGLTDMGAMFRYNLSSMQLSTMQEEIDNVHAYTRIQNILHNNRLTLDVYVPNELLDISVPRLILQPIVENAITHGFGHGHLTITINIQKLQNYIAISILNDGKIIPQQRLTQIHQILRRCVENPAEPVDDCIALVNVQRRLALRYNSFIDISSDKNTRVCLRLPIPDS